ncbi:cytochrome c oxidase subunit 3 [Deinococcus sp. KSM4-11]|uniref:cytochrome c oxidase subunit 3 n=1 Tax=Deinococcus sp. KSM4-11 TaxID=2568654 RepID=UPI001F0F5B8B|nr:cytochrome c oxidase subunit 3 [Deinococcus sp. KSM4-11]
MSAAAAPSARRPDAYWGMAVFLVTDAVIFLLLLVAHAFLRRQGHGPGAGALSAAAMLPWSAALWASSAALVLAPRVRRAWASAALYGLGALLGAAFLLGQGLEYRHLLAQGHTVTSDLFFTGFYTLTALHGLHVFLGLPLLTALATLAARGRLTERRAGFREAATLYWHFVDAVWVVLYAALYVWGGP